MKHSIMLVAIIFIVLHIAEVIYFHTIFPYEVPITDNNLIPTALKILILATTVWTIVFFISFGWYFYKQYKDANKDKKIIKEHINNLNRIRWLAEFKEAQDNKQNQ